MNSIRSTKDPSDFSSSDEAIIYSDLIFMHCCSVIFKELHNSEFTFRLREEIRKRIEMAYKTYGPGVWQGALNDDASYPKSDLLEEVADVFVYYAIGSATGKDMSKLLPSPDAVARPRSRNDGTVEKLDIEVTRSSKVFFEGIICMDCGEMMVRTGMCNTCPRCGSNDGCG